MVAVVVPMRKPVLMTVPASEVDGLRMELRVCQGEITSFIDVATPSLDALERATWELGPAAHQHVARIRYHMERLSVREYGGEAA